MLEEILVPVTHTDGDRNAVDAAAALARRHGGRVALAIGVVAPPLLSGIGGAYPGAIYAQQYREQRDRADALAGRWREELARADVPADVRVFDPWWRAAADILALQARYADLVVMAAPGGGDERAALDALFADVLTASGRPMLVVPPAHRAHPPCRRAVVAWQPTREAARAVHDALPLLHGSDAVDVLVVDPDSGATSHGEQPGADIAAHLARHRLNVRVVCVPSGGPVAQAIVRHAALVEADLIVAGGYSHARLREQIVGGVTRDLFAHSPVPVLFSH